MNGIRHPSEGKVLIDDQDPAVLKGREITRLRQKVGLVFQSPEDQLFANSVYEDIAFGPKNLGVAGSELDNRSVGHGVWIWDLRSKPASTPEPERRSEAAGGYCWRAGYKTGIPCSG